MINIKNKRKIIRTTTIPASLDLIEGQLKYLSNYYEVVAVSSSGNNLEKVGRREGVKVQAVDMERQISIFKDLISLIKLVILFFKEKPYIVHSITPKAGLLSMTAAWIVRVPVRIHTFTGLIFPTSTGFKQKLLIFIDRVTCYSATRIIPEGEGVKKDLISYRITNKPINVLANGNVNGINTTYFSIESIRRSRQDIRKDLGFLQDDFIFIFVGRIVKDKGIHELLEAFRNINKSRIKLLLLGRFERELDPISQEDEDYINSCEDINFIGYQSDVRDYLYASDVLVLPSYREGFPNSVIQAGAMGLPSVVTDINGSNEIIIEGKNGLIVPSKDSNSLYEAMNYLVNNNEVLSYMASNSRPMVVDRFQQSLVWEALLSEYQKND